MDRRPRVSFLSPLDDRQVFGLLPHHSDQSSSQDRVTELIIEKFPLPAISSNISRCICCSLCNWLTAAIPLRQSHLCKCCFIDEPLLTELVHNWWTGRMETQSITLAVYLWQRARNNLNLKPSSFDCFIATWPTDFAAWSVARAGVLKKAQRQGSLGFWGVETLRRTQATTWTSLTRLAFRCSLASSRSSSPSQSSHQPLRARRKWRTDLHALFFDMCFIFRR